MTPKQTRLPTSLSRSFQFLKLWNGKFYASNFYSMMLKTQHFRMPILEKICMFAKSGSGGKKNTPARICICRATCLAPKARETLGVDLGLCHGFQHSEFMLNMGNYGSTPVSVDQKHRDLGIFFAMFHIDSDYGSWLPGRSIVLFFAIDLGIQYQSIRSTC